ncbi:MAG: hypothetical protein A2418_02405 [Candidatus Brennerbacteria bacterium RIFOXYC1_FULL_41_11]|uniref:Peptidase M50 domain-containing protein n=1 Tax=Candidatus Brennerbacteria bacterium RIFOXYD1_FULL_41_16 TaxID=1797529 RepID=A0A1G1XJK4_9BACT|nr:MAG: hypothetical protein UU61_C0006G0009 [Parcubacteria group bacterium GW2011_GWB1_41_4]OGY38752.1 MAG: hypothetical protein A2391_02160 [Candidatus Brennerbacteria bacterium RIFOXYB1_FULL_41_13]OGY39035.1 MAG: hypothetical protein A2418_02405 [Candidatus Brennerbacteria bacterium RIFOXYC1_FULL_41_11]OGY40188.1 MAG: hypothetical protein A2570_02785 [Candidatus Brennerbacteria bacterium RIFOXYD1_FULL_41_16]
METVFYFLVFIFSAVIHEVSHGFVAKALGDDTAEKEGRLTLNPIKHLDPIGSILLPFVFYLTSKLASGQGMIFGWAKPVPFNPYNLKNPKQGSLLIALAGPLSNFFVAFCLSLVLRLGMVNGVLAELFGIIVLINLALAVFNLMPIPPLDGSKVLFGLLPDSLAHVEDFLERNSMIFFLMFFLWGGDLVYSIVFGLFSIFTGVGGY